ncbi:uncharacterized protein LOC130718386 [Lotus japonicus]|uniref:uncharacterized protein LOC130718386 n=1 Tax=Lotus japonicus TaxID=34305 RepID=UPI0025887CEB|nr:uncharacterized protein LOC130718386 [Lotus japonicus]
MGMVEKLVRIEHNEDGFPKVFVVDSVVEELSLPWKDALVVKLIGNNLGYNMMKSRLRALWKPARGFDIIVIDHGFYMVKFDREEDRDKVLHGGPWMIFDHCVVVALWSPNFVSATASSVKTLVWLRFPSLNPTYYEESFLRAIAGAFGKPVKVDVTPCSCIGDGMHGSALSWTFANVPSRRFGSGSMDNRGLRGRHMICDKCGCFGHLGRNCERNMGTPIEGDALEARDPVKQGAAAYGKGKAVVVADNATPAAEEDWIPVKGNNSKSKKLLQGI